LITWHILHLANIADRLPRYDVLANPVCHLRGQKGKVKIGLDQFSGYCTDFALYWAFRIFIYTCREFVDIWPGEDDSSLEALLPSIEKLSPVPIITSSKLESW